MLNILNEIYSCAILVGVLGLILGYLLAKDYCNKEENKSLHH